jgi:hypothetical protein
VRSTLALSYTHLACPADGLCVLVGTQAGSSILRDTTATTVAVPTKFSIATAIACDSPERCTAADANGRAMTISPPWKGWSDPYLLPGKAGASATALASLDCPQVNVCVGVAFSPPGVALRTTNAGAPHPTWTRRPTGTKGLVGIGCAHGGAPSPNAACTAVGAGAAWSQTANTGVNWDLVNAVPALKLLDCPAGAPSGVCVGAGKEDIGKTTSAGQFWTAPFPGITALDPAAVSCLGYPQCLVIGKSKVLGSPDGGATWNFRFAAGDVTAGPAGGTCVAPNQCYGAGNGAIFTTFDGAQSPWQAGPVTHTATPEELTAMACPTPTVCLVTGKESIYRGTLEVVGGRAQWSWVATDAEAVGKFEAISCSSPGSCTAVGGGGNDPRNGGQVATTTDPALLHWGSQRVRNTIDPSGALDLDAVSCPAGGICVAGALRGFVITTTDNWSTHTLEQLKPPVGRPLPLGQAEPAPDVNGVSCQSPALCMLLGTKSNPTLGVVSGAVYAGVRGG